MALQGDAIVLKNKGQRCSEGDVVESTLGKACWRSRIKTELEYNEGYMLAKTRRQEFDGTSSAVKVIVTARACLAREPQLRCWAVAAAPIARMTSEPICTLALCCQRQSDSLLLMKVSHKEVMH
jgi:hypothetical protein